MSSLLEFIQTQEEAFRSRSRLASLYSDFRSQRSSNPDGYAANSHAWLRALIAAADAGKLPGQVDGSKCPFIITTGEELAAALQTPQYGRPLALQTVLEDAITQSQLIPVADFLAVKGSIYEKSWLPTPWQVIDWALTRIGTPFRGNKAGRKSGELVVISVLERLAKLIETESATTTTSNVSRIFSRELFLSRFASILGSSTLSPTSFKTLMVYLSRDRRCLTYDDVNDVIKFKASGDTAPVQITREDIDIASLRTLIASLDKQVASIEEQVSEFGNKVRNALSTKNMPGAKRNLRLKKQVEMTLQQRQATLDQLSDVYYKIEQAADQVDIVQVMQSAGRTLKVLNQQAGDVDDIRDIMDDLRESMADTDDITNAINSQDLTAVDETEIDDELEALERQEREAVSAKEQQQAAERTATEAEEIRQRLAGLDVPLRDEVKSASASTEIGSTDTAKDKQGQVGAQ